MGNFQRFRSGQHLKLNEPTINAMIAAGENWARHCNDPGDSTSPEYYFEGNIIQVRNDSGYDMPRFSVAGLGDALITPSDNLAEFQNYPRFSVRVPILPDDSKTFCVLVEPLAAGAIGLAMISGIVPCQIWREPSDDLPLYADVKNGEIGYLKRSSAGAGVLWCDAAPGSAGPVWALVRIPESSGSIIPFELKTDLTAGSYATAYPMKSDESDADTSADTFTVYDEPEGDRHGLGRDTTGTSGGAHGARGHASYDAPSGHWQIISLGGQNTWGKVQSGFSNAAGSATQTVSVKPCDWQGTISGSPAAFDVKTPIRANRDTALFTDYLVRWHVEPDGIKLIDSDCWDDPIGTIRAVGVDTAIRDGWVELDGQGGRPDARGRFVIGKASDAGGDAWKTYEATGGTSTHTHLSHPDASGCVVADNSGTILPLVSSFSPDTNHSTSSHMPPWIAYKWIKRTT